MSRSSSSTSPPRGGIKAATAPPPLPPSAPSSSTATARVHKIASHMASSAMPTSFPPDRVPLAPDDPLFGMMQVFRADDCPDKVDLGIGAYRDDEGQPWVLPVVKKVDAMIRDDPTTNHEYLPIAGLAELRSRAAMLILGTKSPALAQERVASLQTVSGTGAVHLAAAFLAQFYGGNRTVLVSDPTWTNHHAIFSNCGLAVSKYPYWDGSARGLDVAGMTAALDAAPDASIVVLHACAHNPTGVDPTAAQWRELAPLLRRKRHFVLFDCAYQGFASGDLDRDAHAVRLFVDEGFEMMVAQSFAKNFGLYGQRAGCLHFVAAPHAEAPATAARVFSQLARLQRSEISNPPVYGGRIVATVLGRPDLAAEWGENLRTMSSRIVAMRKALRAALERLATPGVWSHITDQIGMFSFTGLSEPQVARMRSEFHVYMTRNGRISMAGVNTRNVDYVASAIDSVVRAVPSSGS